MAMTAGNFLPLVTDPVHTMAPRKQDFRMGFQGHTFAALSEVIKPQKNDFLRS